MKKLLSLIIALALTLSLSAPAFAAQESYTLALEAGSATVAPGGTVTVRLTLSRTGSESFELYAMQDYVRFNPTVLEYVADSLQVYEGSGLAATAQDFDLDGKVEQIFLNRVGTEPLTLASGVALMEFQLRAVGSGSATVSHHSVELTRMSGEPLSVTLRTAAVTISSGSGQGGGLPGGPGGGSPSPSEDVTITADGGSVTQAQLTEAVAEAAQGSTITVDGQGVQRVRLSAGGLGTAAENGNHVAVLTQYGQLTLSPAAIQGLYAPDSATIQVVIVPQTESNTDRQVQLLLSRGAAVFDVSVLVNGVAIHQFAGDLSVTLTVSGLAAMTDPRVLHILADGNQETHTPTVEGEEATVTGLRTLSYLAVLPAAQIPAQLPFTDVAGHWGYAAIVFAYENKLFQGTSATTFSPNATTNRAMIMTVLARLDGVNTSGTPWYEKGMNWAVEAGVSDGTYPLEMVTREQMVTMLYRYAGSPTVTGSLDGYSDAASVRPYARDAMIWAVSQGIIVGTSATTLSPQGGANRAQLATLLMNYIKLMGR